MLRRRLPRLTAALTAGLLGATLLAPGPASARPDAPWLYPTGTDVPWRPGAYCVNYALNALAGQHVMINGWYTQESAEGMKSVQRFFGLYPDGVVGPDTGDLIRSVYIWRGAQHIWDGYGCWNDVPTH